MQYSFYGGQQGKNFEISAIFENKVEMMQDLMKRYQSDIGVGELVLISYGSPSTEPEKYQKNKQIDIDADLDGHSFNGTLWQKIYTEEGENDDTVFASGSYGLGYKMLVSLTGTTPIIDVRYVPIKAGERPRVSIDTSNVDLPIITFYLPVSQIIALGELTILNADEEPKVEMDSTDVDHPKLKFSLPQSQVILEEHVSTTPIHANQDPKVIFDNDPSKIYPDGTNKKNRPSVEFQLPRSQVLTLDEIIVLDADEDPTFEIDSTDIDHPKIKVGIPRSQLLELGIVTTLDADQEPTADVDDSDINKPKLDLSLPRSQIMQLNPTVVLAPLENPDVTYNDEIDINHPQLTLSLPRAVRFMYGNKLGERGDGTYQLTIDEVSEIAELRPGDYYIHEGTGFIYLVTAESDTSRTFEYKACLAAPVPSITTATVDPYEFSNNAWKVRDPRIEKTWKNDTEKTGLVLGFKLPRLPNLKGQIEFCGSIEEGSIEGKPTASNEFTYYFVVPSGARFFYGDQVDSTNSHASIAETRPGDYYINTDKYSDDRGNIYKLELDKSWTKVGNLKGDTGDPLNIIASFTITSDDVAQDSLQAVSKYLEDILLEGNRPKENELVSITYENEDETDSTSVAYWYYIVKDEWQRVQLTGSMRNFIENEYINSPSTNPVVNKTYSIDYINKLIGGSLDENKDKSTLSKEQLIDLFSWHSFADAEEEMQ